MQCVRVAACWLVLPGAGSHLQFGCTLWLSNTLLAWPAGCRGRQACCHLPAGLQPPPTCSSMPTDVGLPYGALARALPLALQQSAWFRVQVFLVQGLVFAATGNPLYQMSGGGASEPACACWWKCHVAWYSHNEAPGSVTLQVTRAQPYTPHQEADAPACPAEFTRAVFLLGGLPGPISRQPQ